MWVTRSNLVRLTGLSTTRVDQLRDQFGNEWEHGSGPALRIYSPLWIQAWAKGQQKSGDDYTERINRAKALKAEHELRVALSEVMTFEEARQEVQALCDDIRGSLDQCCHPCQQKIRSAIEGADNPPESVNGHSDSNPKPAKRKRSVSRPSA